MKRCLWIAIVLSLSVGCPDSSTSEDAAVASSDAPRDAVSGCTENTDCDDGVYCNGTETCAANRCLAGAAPQCDDSVACTADFCSEASRACVNQAPDADGDGEPDAACVDARGTPLGTDCDDANGQVFSGALEVCDRMAVDEDCNPSTRGAGDLDGDGFQDVQCCNGALCGDDCNDAIRGVNPMATEVCNGIDDDCDSRIDEGVTVTVYRDQDGDGRGAGAAMMGCASSAHFSTFGDDCNDMNVLVRPGLPEVCDGIDNDCVGVGDAGARATNWYRDADGDGFGDPTQARFTCAPPTDAVFSLLPTDCDDTRAATNPAQAELCDGIDNDCNGVADFVIAPGNLEDDDRDGVPDSACTPAGRDCDDRDASSSTGVAESCDGRDNDCDSRIDEAVVSFAYYRDMDGDGYGSDASGVVVGCVPVGGYVRLGGDCDDTDATRRPGGSERCDGRDQDCDGAVDEAPGSSECTVQLGRERVCRGAAGCVVGGCAPGFSDCSASVEGCETEAPTCPVGK